jgi:hypothetical protein
MALRLTQTLTEMNTRNLPRGKEQQAHKADNLTANCEPIVKKIWEPRRLKIPWASTACLTCKPYYIESKIFSKVNIIKLFPGPPINADFVKK